MLNEAILKQLTAENPIDLMKWEAVIEQMQYVQTQTGLQSEP